MQLTGCARYWCGSTQVIESSKATFNVTIAVGVVENHRWRLGYRFGDLLSANSGRFAEED